MCETKKKIERKGFVFKRKGFIKRKVFLLFKNLQKKRKEKKIISTNPIFCLNAEHKDTNEARNVFSVLLIELSRQVTSF